MRNWNLHDLLLNQRPLSSFWSYLWGIETTTRKAFPSMNGPVLIVPMRNWNHLPSPPVVSYKICFDRTYEELKPEPPLPLINWLAEFWSYLWGIETPFNRHGAGRLLLRFDRTYEELKPLPVLPGYSFRGGVLIVPMRNWNPPVPVRFSPLSCRFWSYLWGIETGGFRSDSDPQLRFDRTYEELKRRTWKTEPPSWYCFDRTYEELKLLTVQNQKNLIHCFDRTYEELKPEFRNPLLKSATRFWSYLWGIETSVWGIRRRTSGTRFDRTYEELKLV